MSKPEHSNGHLQRSCTTLRTHKPSSRGYSLAQPTFDKVPSTLNPHKPAQVSPAWKAKCRKYRAGAKPEIFSLTGWGIFSLKHLGLIVTCFRVYRVAGVHGSRFRIQDLYSLGLGTGRRFRSTFDGSGQHLGAFLE